APSPLLLSDGWEAALQAAAVALSAALYTPDPSCRPGLYSENFPLMEVPPGMLAGEEELPDMFSSIIQPVFGTRTWRDPLCAEGRFAQAGLVRCLFGTPFRPAALPPAVLAWNVGTAVKLARVIADQRRWEDLPVLADALEEAGCNDAAVLAHCRGPGPHARGCHVL